MPDEILTPEGVDMASPDYCPLCGPGTEIERLRRELARAERLALALAVGQLLALIELAIALSWPR